MIESEQDWSMALPAENAEIPPGVYLGQMGKTHEDLKPIMK